MRLRDKVYERRPFFNRMLHILLGVDGVLRTCEEGMQLVTKKGHGDYVTNLDLSVEKYLRKELTHLLPDAGFLGEESGQEGNAEYMWVVDPIDGTTNMLYGYDFAVSVALQCAGETVLGMVYVPDKKVLYYARKGVGAYKKDLVFDTESKLHVYPSDGNEGIILFGMPYDRSRTGEILGVVEKLYAVASDMKRIGPASLDMCRVAEGKAKGYVELNLQAWDIAAGKLILEESGCAVQKVGDLYICAETAYAEVLKGLLYETGE